MALTEQSSVVFSIQKLVDTEAERAAAERAEREATLRRKRDPQQQDLERERQRADRKAVFEGEAEQRRVLLLEAEHLKAQLKDQNAMELDRLRSALEQDYRIQSEAGTIKISSLAGRQRMLGAALATVLAGTGLFWLLIVVPSQHRASDAYTALASLYEGSLKERRASEEAFILERRELKQRIDRLLQQNQAKPPIPEPTNKPPIFRPKPLLPGGPVSSPECKCLKGDPLCACLAS